MPTGRQVFNQTVYGNSGNSGGGGGGSSTNWNPKPLAPGDKGYVPLAGTGTKRKKTRNRGRIKNRGKRR